MKSTSLTLASVAAAIGASLCCLGPTLAVALGLGTFGLASTFEAARPYLLVLVGVLFAGAFYRTYRPKAAEACAIGACPHRISQQRQKALLWIGLGVAVLFAAFPYYSGMFWDNGASVLASAGSPTFPAATSPVRSTSLHIEGMFCSGCAAIVESALSHVDGVRRVSVSLEQKSAAVEYEPSRVTPERMQAAVSGAGYTASVVNSDKE
jgi:mercuric ion transport protein